MRALVAVHPADTAHAGSVSGASPQPEPRQKPSREGARPSLARRSLERVPLVGTVLTVVVVGAWAAANGIDGGRLVILLALAPLFEETAFRAGLHEILLRRERLAPHANVLTAIAFGVAHALFHGHALAAAVALPAWLVGLAYERTRRVRPCVALHALFNAVWVAWVVAGPIL